MSVVDSPNSYDLQALEYAAMVSAGHSPANPKLSVRDLSPKMQEMVGALIVRLLKRRDSSGLKVSDEVTYLYALEQFGLRCPHRWKPKSFYRNGRHEFIGGVSECVICGTWEYPAKPKPAEGRQT